MRRPTSRRTDVTVWALTLACTVATVGLLPLAPSRAPLVDDVALPWWLMMIAFAVTEVFVVHLQVGRTAQTISLAEIPLVVGLFFTDTDQLFVAAVVGPLVAFAFHRRQSAVKLAFNAAHIAAETAIAIITFHLVLGNGDPLDYPGMAAALAAAGIADLLAATIIAIVVRVHDGAPTGPGSTAVFVSGAVAACTTTSLGLLVVHVLWSSVQAVWLLVVVSAVLLMAYRAYGALRRKIASTEALYAFTRSTARAMDLDLAVDALLDELRQTLRADVAALALYADVSGTIDHIAVRGREGDAQFHRALTDWAEHQRPHTRAARVSRTAKRTGDHAVLDVLSARDGMLTPLRLGDVTIGTVFVADHVPDVETFTDDDLQLLQAMANHAAVTLDNGRLVRRLREEAAARAHQALHDTLTGLPNRAKFGDLVEARLARDEPLAVIVLGLDRLKEVNDTLGHSTGDSLLVEVATRLRDGLAGLLVARLGGDEFAVLDTSATTPDAALRTAARALDTLRKSFALGDLAVEVNASVGIALAPVHGTDAATMLQHADVALYGAKEERGSAMLYDPARDPYSPARLALVGELRRAIEDWQLDVHYQPKVTAAGVMVGVEALARWDHPVRGPIRPDEFVSVAESTGLIRPLTYLVLRRALDDCASWRRAGLDLHVAVNLSVRSLLDPSLPSGVEQALDKSGVPPQALTLEITEGSAMVDPPRTVETLQALHDLGLLLAIDDYGQGYSSLSYLKRLPVSELKIDRAFVSGMTSNPDDRVIVASTIDMAHSLGLRVIAEGIEDAPTWQMLRRLGCDVGQGYFLGRPMPATALMPWLRDRPAGGVTPAVAHART